MKLKKAIPFVILGLCILTFGIWTRFQNKQEKIAIKGVNLQRTNAYDLKGIDDKAVVKWQQLIPFSHTQWDIMLYKDYLIYMSPEEIVAFNKEKREEAWSIRDNFGESLSIVGNSFSNMVINEDVLYYTIANKVIGVDAGSGKQKWSYELGKDVKLAAPIVSKGIIYFGSSEGKLYAVNISSKREKWSANTTSQPVNISLDDSNVYCSDKENVYSISIATGEKNWGKPFPFAYQLVLDKDSIYFKCLNYTSANLENGILNYMLTSISKKSGEKNWEKQFNDRRVISSDMILYENKLYYTDLMPNYYGATSIEDAFGTDHAIHAINTKDGSEAWKVDRYKKYISGLSVAGGELYAAIGDKTFKKLSVKDGSEISSHKLDFEMILTPVFQKEKMYFIGINFSDKYGTAHCYIGLME